MKKLLLLCVFLAVSCAMFARPKTKAKPPVKEQPWFIAACPHNECGWTGQVQAISVITNGGHATSSNMTLVERTVTIKCPMCLENFDAPNQLLVPKVKPAVEVPAPETK